MRIDKIILLKDERNILMKVFSYIKMKGLPCLFAFFIFLVLSGCKQKEVKEEYFDLKLITYEYTGDPFVGEYGSTIKKMVEEYTKTNLNIMWIPSDPYDEKINSILSNKKNLPHIIAVDVNNLNVINAAKSDMFWDVTDLIDDYKNLSQGNEVINDNIRIDGRLYGVYRGRFIGRIGLGYRKDWAEGLNIGVPKTINDIEKMMKAFTYDDPDGNGIDDTYGLVLSKNPMGIDTIMSWFGVPNGWYINEENNLTPNFYKEEYLTALTWIRKMYQIGCINPDFPLKDSSVWTNDLKNGFAGIMVQNLDDSRRVDDYFKQNGIDGEINLVGAIEGYDGVKRTLGTSGNNGFFAITKTAKTVDEVRKCLEFLDKMNDEEMVVLADYGLEGRHYNYTEDGRLVRIKNAKQSNEFACLNQLVTYNAFNRVPSIDIAENEIYELQERLYVENERYAVMNPVLKYINDSKTYLKKGDILYNMMEKARIKFIVGEIDEEGLAEAIKQWEVNGGLDLIKEVNILYHK